MKKLYTTAQGKQLSMDSVRLSNETVIAVGNMKVNARGDQLGPGGIPEKSKQDVINEYYNLHTPVAGAHRPGIIEDRPAPVRIAPQAEPDPVADPLIAEQDEIEIVKPPQTEMRGKLADAVAKTAVVNQELLKPAKQQIKDTGPTRI
jgi:hypothetical protein